MSRIAILILASQRPESCRFDPALQEVAGVTVLRRLMVRLWNGSEPLAAWHAAILPEGSDLTARFTMEAAETGFQILPSHGASPLEMLAEFVEQYPDCETLVLYPELAGFPDMITGRDMISEHMVSNADATVAPRLPEGLLPAIFRSAAIRRLKEVNLPSECGGDVLGLMQNASRLFPDEPEFQFEIHRYDAKKRGMNPAALPAHMYINDKFRREAAERVIQKTSAANPLDATEAELLKMELVEAFDDQPGIRPEGVYSSVRRRPVPILFSSFVYGFSGAEASWVALITGLDRSRFEAIVMLPCPSVLSELLLAAGVEVEFAQWDFTAQSPQSLLYFSRFLKTREIALVDINGGVGLPLLIASAWAGIPVVTHVRSYDTVTMQDSLQFSDVIVTVSNAVQEDVRRCEIRPEKVVTVYNGVDLRAFAPGVITRADGRGRLGIDGDEATIAFVARISPEKRYELFLSALARLRKRRPGLAALCVGEAFPSERGYYKRLKELVARLDLTDVVRWIGFTKDMATIYTAADVLVVCNPSEPLARCCIEACAMGLPVIAPRSGGSTEIVEHNKNGLLFEPDDVDSLVSTLETYLEDETLRANLQRGALAKAPQFSIDRHVTAMMNIFDGLLARELKEETVGSGVQWCAA